MGTIILHAGMSKTGSSAIQGYLVRGQRELAAAGVVVAAGRPDGAGVRVEEFRSGPVNSGDLVPHLRDPSAGPAAAMSLADELDRLARGHPWVVLTGEAFEQPFWRPDHDVLAALQQLAGRHHVRVAYYVRPQHTALEAAWRQWGFRSGWSPAAYLRDRARAGDRYRYRYLSTLHRVRELAPDIDLAMRPFRRDLLVGGDVVTDFVSTFLPVHARTPDVVRDDNVGLALDLVNMLQFPAGAPLWTSAHHNRLFNHVKQLYADVDAAPSPDALRGRDVLQAWCHETFEPENQDLVRALGWRTDAWVPAGAGAPSDLALLDELWRAPAPPAVVDAFVATLTMSLGDGCRLPNAEPRSPACGPPTGPGEDLRRAYERLRVDHDRLRRRRAVRAALRVANLARPVVRRVRRR